MRLIRVGSAAVVVFCVSFCPRGHAATPSRELDLGESIHLALERNEDLLLAVADVERAGHVLREAHAGRLPQLDVTGNYQRNWLLPSFVFAGNQVKIGTQNSMTGMVELRQPLYLGGQVRSSIASALLSGAAAEAAQRHARQQVIARVATDFYSVLLATELSGVSAMALITARRAQDQVESLFRAGRAPEYDMLRTAVRVANLVADSLRSANALETARLNFAATVGLDLPLSFRLIGDFDRKTSLDLDDLGRLIEMGLRHHPQLKQLDMIASAQQRRIDFERSAGRPSLYAVGRGQLQLQSDGLNLFEREWARSWDTGVVLSVPVFDGMQVRARVAQARVDLHRAELKRLRLERVVRVAVQQSVLTVSDALERVTAQEVVVQQASRGLDIAQSRYRAGVSIQLEVLDAQLSLVRAQTATATARRDHAIALIQLEQSVGILGEESGDV